MGLWSFGRDSEMGFATRVVSAVVGDGVKLRGKLTVDFRGPRPRDEAQGAADACAALCARLLAESHDHRRLLGGEAGLITKIKQRLPDDFPEYRAIELVSLHVVGEGASTAARTHPAASQKVESKALARISLQLPSTVTSSGRKRPPVKVELPESRPPPPPEPKPIAVSVRDGATRVRAESSGSRRPPAAAPSSQREPAPRRATPPPRRATPVGREAPASRRGGLVPRQESRRPPASTRSGSAGPSRRPSPRPRALRRRAQAWERAMASLQEGASLEQLAGPLGAMLRDSAARLVFTVLLAIDHPTFDVMAALDPTADGVDRVDFERIGRESGACAACVLYGELLKAGLPQNVVIDMLQTTGDVLPGGALPVLEISRYLGAPDASLALAIAVLEIPDSTQEPSDVATAIAPVVVEIRDAARAVARALKRATGL